MPVTPYTWIADDFLTASRLNGELYRTLGQYIQANGTGWHAARPVFKAFYGTNAGFSSVSGTWTRMSTAGTPGKWPCIGDTGGYLASRGDASEEGIFSPSWPNGGGGTIGGASNPNGGLALMIVNQSFAADPVGGNVIAAGLGQATAGTPFTACTSQPTNTALPQGPWGLDLMDVRTAGGLATFAISTSSTAQHNLLDNADGSGHACRFQGFWASMYPANGTTVASLPTPQASWTATTPSLTASLMNGLNGIAATMNLFNMPPALRAFGTPNSVPNATATACHYGTVSYDTYSAYNNSTFTYTVPLTGLYLVYNCFPVSISSGQSYSAVAINGTTYFGPACPAVASGQTASSKVQIFSLNAGDTIVPQAYQNSGATMSAFGGVNGFFVVLYLGMLGAPGVLPTVPDITYSFTAGTPGSSMPALLNSHLANDLLYLTQRPYLLAYQNTTQTGIPMATLTPVTMNSITGIVHGDNGDNYSGWGSGLYTAQRAGWYLAVMETSFATPTLTATPTSIAAFKANPGGSTAADYYQQMNMYTGGAGSGASAVGIYYLRAGDTLQPILDPQNASATTISTFVASGHNCHFEMVWLGE